MAKGNRNWVEIDSKNGIQLKHAKSSEGLPETDFSEIEIVITEDDERRSQEAEITAKDMKAWFKLHLPKLDSVREKARKSGNQIRLAPEVQKGEKEIFRRIDKFLDHSVPLCRQTAWLEYLFYQLKNADTKTLPDAVKYLNNLVKMGLLEDDDEKGALKGFGMGWRIPDKACFRQKQFIACEKVFSELVQKVAENENATRIERFRSHASKNQPSEESLLSAEEDGSGMIYVPPEISEETGGSFRQWFGGFMALSTTRDGRIYPKEGFGYFNWRQGIDFFAREITRANSLGVLVLAKSLAYNRPPASKVLFDRGLSEAQVKKVHFTWHLLKRKLTWLTFTKENGEQLIQEKLALSKKNADTAEDEFFLEGANGTALVDYQGLISLRNGTKVWGIPLLVERHKDVIRVKGLPDRVEPLFQGLLKEYPEGEKFEGVSHPLTRAILQISYAENQIKSLRDQIKK